MKPVLSIVVLVLAGAGVAGCMQRDKIDTDKLKKIVEQVVAPVEKIDCPGASAKKGSTFDCKVRFVGGRDAALKVTMTNDKGDADLHWEKPVGSAEKLAQTVVSGIKTQANKDATVDCGKGVVDIPPDGIKCTVTMGGETGHAIVKMDAANQEYVWSLEGPPPPAPAQP